MDKEFPTLDVNASIMEAAKTLADTDLGYIIVLEKGKPKGIATEKDIILKVLIAEKDAKKTSIGSIMSTPLITIDPDEDLLVASEIMQKNKIKRIPVVKDDIIYGVITAVDIARSCSTYIDKATRDVLRWSFPI
ncbi:CBS domain-containing protein [Candidatus Bathyarchaeota archaeon]|nr:CBS domain-containing protein [Candidatus Bathyarchaeota archaeon]